MMIPAARAQKWAAVATAATLTLAVLVLVASLASAFGPAARPLVRGVRSLDYSRGALATLARLSDTFVEKTLRTTLPGTRTALRPDAAGPGSGRSAEREGAPHLDEIRRTVRAHPLTNDSRRTAYRVDEIPFTAQTNTATASREPEEPNDCAAAGPTVWYSFEPKRDTAILAYTFGTDHAVSLAVYDDRGSQVACDGDIRGNALVAFTALAATTYRFQITAQVNGGDLVFSIDPQGTTTLASRTSSGEEPNGGTSQNVQISGDGRYVLFGSDATNFEGNNVPCLTRTPEHRVIDPATPCTQLYFHDRQTRTTALVSKTAAGEPLNAGAAKAFMTANARFITYETVASNIDPDDLSFGWDLFIYDRLLDRTDKIPVRSKQPDGTLRESYTNFFMSTVSEDGRYVAFNSPAGDLLPHGRDSNNCHDAFVYDRSTGSIERVSVSSTGEEARGMKRCGVVYPSISADGRYVEFISGATNLVPGDTNGVDDVFLHDRLTRATERISIGSQGQESGLPVGAQLTAKRRISADGRFVAFVSGADFGEAAKKSPTVYVRDRLKHETVRVATAAPASSAGDPAPAFLAISPDGRYVVFDTRAPNVAPGDSDEDWDVVLYDLSTRTSILVTLGADGGDRAGQGPAMSSDGRVVAYTTPVVDRELDIYVDSRVYAYEAARLR